MSLPFVMPSYHAARRRRPAVLLAALLGALGLVLAALPGTAWADYPISTINSPVPGAQVGTGRPATVLGGSLNGESAGIVRVDLSLDGGQTWQPTQLSSSGSWSYTFTPTEPGVLTLVSRAATRYAVESPDHSVTLKVADSTGAGLCPCTVSWPSRSFPVHDEDDAQPVELGLRFSSTRDGYVTGLMFMRYRTNQGPHVAHLWDADGTMLAEQIVNDADFWWANFQYPYIEFAQPVPISRDTVYTVSYYTPTGHYASSEDYFSQSAWAYGPEFPTPIDYVPPSEGAEDYAGVYHYGEGGGFPTETWHASNYWVEPVFTTG